MKRDLLMNGGGLKGWKIKLGKSDDYYGFGSSYEGSYCTPLSADTPEFSSFALIPNFPTYLVQEYPQFSHYPSFDLKADKGIIYRADNPDIVYPAKGIAEAYTQYTILNAFYPIFLNNGETIDEVTNKEYTIIYDPDREYKPQTKLTVTIAQYRDDNDEAGRACCYSSQCPLFDFNTLTLVTEYYKVGSVHELALTYEYFYMQLSYEGKALEMVNCEQVQYFSQFGILFRVLDTSQDVSLVYATYDPT